MRKLTLFVAILATSFANAQISKGSKIIGTSFASAGFTSSDNETVYSNTPTIYKSEGNSFSFSINPYVGFFLADGFALGGSIGASFYSSKSTSSNSASTTTTESKYSNPGFSIGPFARYYFVKGQKMSPYVELGGGIDFYPSKSESISSTGSSSTTKTKNPLGWNAGPKLGFEYFISEYVGLNVSAGVNYGASSTTYEYRPSSGTGYDYTSDYNRLYVPINFGLQIHLPSKSGQ